MAHRLTSLRLTDNQKVLWKAKAHARRMSKNEYLLARLEEMSEKEIGEFERSSLGPGEGRKQVTFPLNEAVAQRLDKMVQEGIAPSKAHVIDALIES